MQENFSDFKPRAVEEPILAQADREILTGQNDSGRQVSFYQSNKYYIWSAVFAVLVIALLSYFAFGPKKELQPVQARVAILIEAPETSPAGADIVYRIKLENQDSKPLTDIGLEMVYAPGFEYVFSQPKPENLSGTRFKVPDLAPGLNATLFLKVRGSGGINENKELKVKLTYKYSNFNSYFNISQSAFTRLTASNLQLSLEGPKELVSGQLVLYHIRYKNNSKEVIKNARVQFEPAEGFSLAQAVPASDVGINAWSIPVLEAGGEGQVTVSGSFTSVSQGEEKLSRAVFLTLLDNGEYFAQATADSRSAVSNFPLMVSQEASVSGSTGVLDPGQVLDVTVRYQNNSNLVATGVNIAVALTSQALDLSTLQAEGAQVSGGNLQWNASGVSNLESLRPGEKGQLSFRVSLKDPVVKDSSKNLTVLSSIKIKSNEYESFFPGQDLSLKISSPVKVNTVVDYVSGSLPPKVGKETVYRVSFSLTNSTNDLSDSVLSMYLPLGSGSFMSESVNAQEKNAFEYDPSTGKLSWKARTVPAHAGKFTQSRQFSFQLKANPSLSQVGEGLVLVSGAKFVASDTFTGHEVVIDVPTLTAADASGNDGYGNGRVEE